MTKKSKDADEEAQKNYDSLVMLLHAFGTKGLSLEIMANEVLGHNALKKAIVSFANTPSQEVPALPT